MDNVASCLEFFIRSLNSSPSEFFKVAEEVGRDYDESRYEHWLCKKLIGLIEKEGLSISEIFTKKVRILHALSSRGTQNFNSNLLSIFNMFKGFDKSKVFSLNFDGLEDVKSFEVDNSLNLDVDIDNRFFSSSLSDEILNLLGDSDATLIVNFSDATVKKDNAMVLPAKQMGIKLNDQFDAWLFRLINLCSTGILKSKVVFLTPPEVFSEEWREVLLDEFLNCFACSEAYLVDRLAISDDLLSEGDLLVSSFIPIELLEDGALPDITSSLGLGCSDVFASRLSWDNDSSVFKVSGKSIFLQPSISYIDYFNSLKNERGTLFISEDLTSIFDSREEAGTSPIIVPESSLDKLVIWLGITELMEDSWLNKSDIPMLVDCTKDYSTLLADLLPVAMYSKKIMFEDLSVFSGLIQTYAKYQDVEAKGLDDFCIKLLEAAKSKGLGGTFHTKKMALDNPHANSAYLTKIQQVKDIVQRYYDVK